MSADTTDPLVTPAECARTLGVSERWIRYWMEGKRPSTQPALATELQAGQACVRVHAAYEHIKAHCHRTPKEFRNPSGAMQTSATQDQGVKLLEGESIYDAIIRIVTGNERFKPEEIKTLISLAKEMRMKQSDELKSAALVKPGDVIKKLRSLRELYVEQIETGGAARLSHQIVRFIHDKLNINLADENPAVFALLEIPIREEANILLDAMRKNVEEQCAGLRYLEGTK